MNLEPGTFQGLSGCEEALFRKVLNGMEGNAIEIGCCDGYSTAVILESSRMFLVSFDPMIPDSMEKTLVGSMDRLLKNTEPYKERWRLVNFSSPPKNFMTIYEISFLFLDGDHSYEAVQADFDFWTPDLAKGGLLAMHDCRMNRAQGATFHKGPSKLADERVFGRPDEWEIVGEAYSLMIARKK